jgi:peptidoglycan hydrolase CwlO-like protein
MLIGGSEDEFNELLIDSTNAKQEVQRSFFELRKLNSTIKDLKLELEKHQEEIKKLTRVFFFNLAYSISFIYNL